MASTKRKKTLAGIARLASGRLLAALILYTLTRVSLRPSLESPLGDVTRHAPEYFGVPSARLLSLFFSVLALGLISSLFTRLFTRPLSSASSVFWPPALSPPSLSPPPLSPVLSPPSSLSRASSALRHAAPSSSQSSPVFSTDLSVSLVQRVSCLPRATLHAAPPQPGCSAALPSLGAHIATVFSVSAPPASGLPTSALPAGTRSLSRLRCAARRRTSVVLLALLVHALRLPDSSRPEMPRSFGVHFARAAQLVLDSADADAFIQGRERGEGVEGAGRDAGTKRREWRQGAREEAETAPPGDRFGAADERRRDKGDTQHKHTIGSPSVLEGNQIPAPKSDHRYRRFVRLANGMEMLLLVDPLQLQTAPSHVALSITGGFLHDPAHLPGLATLSGHLVFNNYVPVSSPLASPAWNGEANPRSDRAGNSGEDGRRPGDAAEGGGALQHAGQIYPSLDAFLFAHNAAEPLHFSTGEFASALSYSLPTHALSASLAQLKHVLLHPNITEASVGVGVIQLLQQQQKQVQKRKNEPYWRKASILKNHVFNPAHKTSRFHVGSTDLIFLLLHHQQQAARAAASDGRGRDASSFSPSAGASASDGDGEGEARWHFGGRRGHEAKPAFERVSLPMLQHVSVWLKNEDLPSLVRGWHERFYVANAFKLVISTPGSRKDLDRLTAHIEHLFGAIPANAALEDAFTCSAGAETPFFSSAKEAEAFAQDELVAAQLATSQTARDTRRRTSSADEQNRGGRDEGGSRRGKGAGEDNEASAPFFLPTRVPQVACGPSRSSGAGPGRDREKRGYPSEKSQTGGTRGSRCGSGSSETTGRSACSETQEGDRKSDGAAADEKNARGADDAAEDGARKRDDPADVPVARHCDLKKEILLEPATDNEHSVDFVFVFEKPHPKWTVFDAKYVVDVLGSEGPGSLIAHLRKQGLAEAIDVEAEESRCYSTLRASVEIKDYNVNHTAITLIGSTLFSYLRFVRESPLDSAFVESRMRMYRLAFDAHVPPLPPRPPLPGALGTVPPLLPSSSAPHSPLLSSSPGQTGTHLSPQEEVAYLVADLQEVPSPTRVFTEQWLFEDVGKHSLESYIDQLTPDNLIVMISSPLVVPLCTLVSSFFGIPFAINALDSTQDAMWSALAALPPDRALLLARRTGFSLPPVSFFLPPANLHAEHHLGEDEVDRFGQRPRQSRGESGEERLGEAPAGGAASSMLFDEEVLFSSREVPRRLSFEDAQDPSGAARWVDQCELFHLPYRSPEQNPPRASVTLLLNYAIPLAGNQGRPAKAADSANGTAGRKAKGRTRDAVMSASEYREKVMGLMGLYVATVKEMLHEVTVYASMAEIAFSIEADQHAPTVEIHVEGVSAVVPVLTELIVKGLMAGSPGPPDARAPSEEETESRSSTAIPPLPDVFACRQARENSCGHFLDTAAFERMKQEKIEELREGAHDLPGCLADVALSALLRDHHWGGRYSKLDLIQHARIHDVEDAGAMLKSKLFLQALVTGDMSAAAAKSLVSNVASRLHLAGQPTAEELSWGSVLSMKNMEFPSFVKRQIRRRGGKALPAVPRYRWRLTYSTWAESNLCSAFSSATLPMVNLRMEGEHDEERWSGKDPGGRGRKEERLPKKGQKRDAYAAERGTDETPFGHSRESLHAPLLRTTALRIELGILTDKELAIAAVLELLLAYPMYRHVCALDGVCHSLSLSLRQEPAGVSYFLLDLRSFDVPACVATERAEAWLFTQAELFSGVHLPPDASAFASRARSATPETRESASPTDMYPSDGETVLLRGDFFKTHYAHSPVVGSVRGKAGQGGSGGGPREARRGGPEERVPGRSSCSGTVCATDRRSSLSEDVLEDGRQGGEKTEERPRQWGRGMRHGAPSCSESSAQQGDRLLRAGPASDLLPSCPLQGEWHDDGFRPDAAVFVAAFDPRQHRAFGEPGFFVLLDEERFQKAKDTAEASFLMLYSWEADHIHKQRQRRRDSGREAVVDDPKPASREGEGEAATGAPGEGGTEGDTFRGRPFIPADIQMFVHEIRKKSYLFGRREDVARRIRSLTLDDVREFFLNSVVVAPWLVIELSSSWTRSSPNANDAFTREPDASYGVGGMHTSGPESCGDSDDYYAERGMPDMTTFDTGRSSNPLWRLRNSWVDLESIRDFREAATKYYTLGAPELYGRQRQVPKQKTAV
ncbi:conserved hypothetical protein [Neospora caninum Liverpool]|uniref:Peptidase M16 middle/third domain-containing protein n=1 Tax=Neospora caninum (strain Liverpool) TaxID=572307 RepID=F0VNQ5_NEOCL|nr:conserved hypothetical protein [Neospora caninum Liverpool]CBZ55351.1 conserved hypothetical protein [Neospora caninum Liverpool]CEL70086.1 TPA: hypothetical protein BN1204_057740 [Neospora caninum Liverpool]|eukprot:XP_003885379.1 conserved hypothetical protein [Neospora caninum Liverpool]